MRQISGGHEFRPHGGLLLSRDWRKSMQNSLFLPGLLNGKIAEFTYHVSSGYAVGSYFEY